MTTLAIVLLMLGAWGQRLAGMFLVGPILERRPMLTAATNLIPAAVISAVVVQLTLARGTLLVLDERMAGMVVASILVWRKAPFIVVVVAAAAATALLRAL